MSDRSLKPSVEPAPEAPAPRHPPKWERVTDKGLPKRTPKITAPESTVPKARSGSVDAEALRKRLGGFHQGAISGRRDVAAELTERTERTRPKTWGIQSRRQVVDCAHALVQFARRRYQPPGSA